MPRGLADPLERPHAHAALGVPGAREVVVDRAVLVLDLEDENAALKQRPKTK